MADDQRVPPDLARPPRRPLELAAYVVRSREGPCFACAILDERPDYPAHVAWQDDEPFVFLARWPTLVGHTLVAPKRHVESLTEDLDEAAYLRLQSVVYLAARAVAATVPTERVYVLSLGSQQGNAHVHWHVAPLPPDVPYEEQQFHALMAENGVLDVSDDEQAALAAAIGVSIAAVADA